MKYLPSPGGSWRRKAIGGLLLIAFLPVLLVAVARAISEVLGPFIPWVIAAVFLFGLYSLVIRRYQR